MDDEKKPITERIARTVKGIVDSTTETAMQAFEPSEPDPHQVAGEANEQVYIPEATDAAATPAPLVPAEPTEPARRVTKKRVVKKASKQVAKAKKAAVAKKAAKKPVKKSSKKASKKTAKKAASKKATKATKRGMKKKGKRG
jgi:hypothetical protein